MGAIRRWPLTELLFFVIPHSPSLPSPPPLRPSHDDHLPSSAITGRAYFKDLRKSGIPVQTDWPRYADLARTRGSIYGNVTGLRRGDASPNDWENEGEQQGEWSEKYDKEAREAAGSRAGGSGLQAEREEARYAMRTPSPTMDRARSPSGRTYPLTPTLKTIFPHDDLSHSPTQRAGKRSSTPGPAQSTQPFIPRSTAISRLDLLSSAERIYSRYLMPGSDKEIYLPPSLRMSSFPLSSSALPAVGHPDYEREEQAQAQVPDMFHRQKEWCYRQMEGESFPRFLRSKAFGNLTPVGSWVRLGVGLALLWVALATAFAFIFLDMKPKVKRLWVSRRSLFDALGHALTSSSLSRRSSSPSHSPS